MKDIKDTGEKKPMICPKHEHTFFRLYLCVDKKYRCPDYECSHKEIKQ